MPPAPARVAAVHFTPAFGEVAANRAALVALAGAAAARAGVVVLPELATTGFALDRARAEAWAEPVDGPTATALAAVSGAADAVVVAGLCLRDAGGALRNAAVVLDRGALAGVYVKHRPFGHDDDWAEPGAEPGAVVPTSRGRLGVLICHDLAWPDVVAALAARRPEVVAFPTNWIEGTPGLPASWAHAAAAFAGAPLAVANRGGAEDPCCRFSEPSAVLRLGVDGRIAGVVSARGAGPEVAVGPPAPPRSPGAGDAP